MIPTEFENQNIVFAKDQPEYLPLPAHKTEDGRVISFWKLEDGDIEKIKELGGIYIDSMTFNKPLQPIGIHIENPFQ